ncbi:MAG: outer membrane protein assembly factor BamA [Candidatus Methylomirabilales bacterium]
MERALRTILLLFPAFLCLLRCPLIARGQEAPIIKEVVLQGNQKVESDAIRQRIRTRVGDPFSPEKIRGDVERVFKMGFFDDVKVEAEELEGGLRLIYVVVEKPTIRSIEIEGADEIDQEDIRDRIDVSAGTVFEPQALGRNADAIRALYEEEGFYTAQVVGRSKKVSDREVDVIFEIQEGAQFFVRNIIFVGNKGITARKIRKIMATKKRFFIAFLRPGVLKRSDLDQDVERIKALYLDRGFLRVKVGRPEIRIDKKASRLDIVIHIEEGPRFRLGEVKVTGGTIFAPEDLLVDLRLPKEEFFSRDVLRKDLATLTEKYSELGYVFADVVPLTRVRPDEPVVDVTLEVTEGIKAFVERIEIRGNTKTRDKVIRRQLELAEGDVYNGKLLQEARAALRRLGYFEAVDLKTARGSAPDQLRLAVDVKEKPTGRVGIGGGFSTGGGAIASVFLAEDNIFGLGKRVRLNGTLGTVTSSLDFRYSDPFFLDSDYSLSLGLFNRISTFSNFDERRRGGEIGFGRRFLKQNSASIGYLYESVEISDVDEFASTAIREEEGTSTTSSVNVALSRDTRDNPSRPTKGYRVSLNNEVAGGPLGADNDFYKVVLDARYHVLLLEEQEVVGMVRARGGFVEKYGDSTRVPLQERFFLGGPTSFRGSDFRELSPRDPATGDRIGGNRFALFTTEVGFPILKEFIDIRGALFFDAAENVGEGEDLTLDLDYAFGAGLGVVTPFGPIRVDVAYNPDPNAENGNDDLLIHFNIGRSF